MLKDGRQGHLGTFGEITAQGFDVDEILQQYGDVGKRAEEDDGVLAIPLTIAQQLEKEAADEADRERIAHKKQRSLKLLRRASTILANERAVQDQIDRNIERGKLQAKGTGGPEERQVNLIAPESLAAGGVTFQDYRNFLSFGAGCGGMILFFAINVATALAQIVPSYLLAEWTSLPLEEQQNAYYPKLFGGFILLYVCLAFVRSLVITALVLSSITNMHYVMVERVSRATILFFDSNPLGRILTRFSKDMAVFDTIVARLLILVCLGVFRTIVNTAAVCVINPWLLIAMLIALVMMHFVLGIGKVAMMQSQRLDSIYRGPIHSTFGNLISGLVTIRINNRVRHFRDEYLNNLAVSTNATFCWLIAMRWMGIRLDIIASLFIAVCAVFCVLLKNSIDTALLAVSLQIITDVIGFFSVSFRIGAEIENYMTSSQRIFEYTQLEQEDDLVKEGDKDLQKRGWPMNGKLEYEGATMRYRKELAPSIKSLSFKALPGMVVGVVGRTGSGKTSILQTLFRLVDLEEGVAKIDGVDITKVGLHQLRRHIAFIP